MGATEQDMLLVDTHCHLQDPKFDADREAVIDHSLSALGWLVVVGDDIESSRRAAELTRDKLYAAVGVHPYGAACVDEEALAQLQELAALPGVVALGEIGLDYYRATAPRPIQAKAFKRQLELAQRMELPVIIHDRDAHDDCVAALQSFGDKGPGGVMHCFSGDAALAERCVDLGYHISFAGNLTFPKAQALRDAAAAVPLNRLLIETDSPYLAPQPVRGKRCEPAYVRYIAETLAQVKGVSLEELADATTANAHRLFGVQVPAAQAQP